VRWSLYARRLNRPHPLLSCSQGFPDRQIDNPSSRPLRHTQKHLHGTRSSSTTYTLFLFCLLAYFLYTITTASHLPTTRPYHIHHSLAPASLRIFLSEIVSTSFLAIACYLTLILGATSTSTYTISCEPWMRDAFLVLSLRGGLRSVFVGAVW
jgi:hypothetical protein